VKKVKKVLANQSAMASSRQEKSLFQAMPLDVIFEVKKLFQQFLPTYAHFSSNSPDFLPSHPPVMSLAQL